MAVWAVFLLISSEDIGFFRNGRPFLPLGGSEGGAGAGSLASRDPAGRLPAPPCPCKSVGIENHEDLVCLFTGIAGRAAWPVFMGGGGALALES
jgi:hypothetical protein